MSAPYVDCTLRIAGAADAVLTVDGAQFTDRPKLEDVLGTDGLASGADPVETGAALFEALFPAGGQLRQGLLSAMGQARRSERRMRLRITVSENAPPELNTLPWELLYHRESETALACSPETVLSRFLDMGASPRPGLDGPPKLLVVLSEPTDLQEYDLAEVAPEGARKAIEDGLGGAGSGVSVEYLEGPATPGRIRERLKDGFHALHLHAHGIIEADGTRRLMLQKDDGTADPVDENRLGDIVLGLSDLRLVTLIACDAGLQSEDDPFGGLAPSLVRKAVPAVVAMRQSIWIGIAETFVRSFYRTLVQTGEVDTAANEARVQLKLLGGVRPQWGAPAVFMRLSDGALWDVDERPSPHRIVLPAGNPNERFPWTAVVKEIGPSGSPAKVIPFLGPGITHGMLPSREDLARMWADDRNTPYPFSDRSSLPNVTQFMEVTGVRKAPHRELEAAVRRHLLEREPEADRARMANEDLATVIRAVSQKYFTEDPRNPYLLLAGMPFPLYMTTNYDSLMVAALEYRSPGSKVRREVCRWWEDEWDSGDAHGDYDSIRASLEERLVFHLFGAETDRDSLVLTEDDHLDFLRLMVGGVKLPSSIKEAVPQHILLLLGYQARDLHSKVLYRGVLANPRRAARDRFLVLQLDPANVDEHAAIVQFFERYGSRDLQVELYVGSVRDFVGELYDRWTEQYGS